jgi:hypothetical protein
MVARASGCAATAFAIGVAATACGAIFGIEEGLPIAGDGSPSDAPRDGISADRTTAEDRAAGDVGPTPGDDSGSIAEASPSTDAPRPDDGSSADGASPDGAEAGCVSGASCNPGACKAGQSVCDDAGKLVCQSTGDLPDDASCPLMNGGSMGVCVGGVCEAGLTFTMIAYGSASQTVSSTPGGISCAGSSCSTSSVYTTGTSVALSVAAGGSGLYHWGGACSGSGSTCNLLMNSSKAVTLTLNGNNYAFITNGRFSANFGGLSGADAQCTSVAAAASLPGSYVAILSTSTVNASTRLGSARGWIRTDGKPVADTPASLFANDRMYYPLSITELGTPSTSYWFPFTGSANDGTVTSISGGVPSTCSDWTSSNAAIAAGTGVWDISSQGWVGGAGGSCDMLNPLFCFGTDLVTPLTFAKATGRIAFLSMGSWDTSTGVAAADALCQSEATAAGLAGASTFIALLTTNSAGAATRLNTAGPNWVRTDGIPIAASIADLLAGNLVAPIAVAADGVTYLPSNQGLTRVMTGGLQTAAGSSTTTCNNWTSSDAGGATGSAGIATKTTGDEAFESLGGYPPCGLYRVYCLQP